MEHIQAEEQVISILLASKEAIKDWTLQPIGDDYFDKIHQNILAGIHFAFNSDVQLTRQTYKEFLAQYKKMTPQETAAEVSLYNRCMMRAAKRDDLPMLLVSVKNAFIRRQTARHLGDYSKDKERLGDIGANRSLIDKLAALEADVSESKTSVIEIGKSKEPFMVELWKRRNNPESRLRCHIKEIDDTMNVGFKEGHLTLFCADVGSFKTTMMVNVAVNMFKHSGENILFIPLEMPPEEILTKIVARETGVPSNLIEHAHALNNDQIEKIAQEMEIWSKNQHRFSIMDMGGRAKLSHIRREIEKRINYFKPRMVFIDYADNLIPDVMNNRSDLVMNDILEDMRQMGKSLGFGVATAAQLARDALKRVREQKEGKQQLGSTDVRGGQVMLANADTAYAQLRDPSQPNQKLIFFCLKARHGRNVFDNNRDRAILDVQADIGLITSPNDVVINVNNMGGDLSLIKEALQAPPLIEDDPF